MKWTIAVFIFSSLVWVMWFGYFLLFVIFFYILKMNDCFDVMVLLKLIKNIFIAFRIK